MKLDYDIYAGGLFLVSGEMKLDLQRDRYAAGVVAKGKGPAAAGGILE